MNQEEYVVSILKDLSKELSLSLEPLQLRSRLRSPELLSEMLSEMFPELWRLLSQVLLWSLSVEQPQDLWRSQELWLSLKRSQELLRLRSLKRSHGLLRSLSLSEELLVSEELWQSLSLSLGLSLSLSEELWREEERLLSEALLREEWWSKELNNAKLIVNQLLSETEESQQQSKKPELVNDADATSYAVELPCLLNWLNQETQTWLVDMRIVWYGDRPLNRKTHIDVWLKTHKYLLFDHFLFRLWDKMTSRSLYRDRIIRLKDSE